MLRLTRPVDITASASMPGSRKSIGRSALDGLTPMPAKKMSSTGGKMTVINIPSN